MMKRASVLPSAVVVSAYRAANRGRYADANRFVSARMRRSILASATGIRKSNRRLAAILPKITNAIRREQLLHVTEAMRDYEDPNLLWKGRTQGGSIVSIEVRREIIRSATATVTVALHLADKRIRVERNRLRRVANGWEIDIIEVLETNEMQATKSANARRRGSYGVMIHLRR